MFIIAEYTLRTLLRIHRNNEYQMLDVIRNVSYISSILGHSKRPREIKRTIFLCPIEWNKRKRNTRNNIKSYFLCYLQYL